MVNIQTKAILWWKHSSLWRKLLYFLLFSGLIAGLFYVQIPTIDPNELRSSLLFFIIINTSIVGLGTLAFVIGRNVIKLIFDRQEGILGSKLRTKLVLAFVGLTLVPTFILFLLASGLISSAMEGWFGKQVEEIVNSSLEVARDHFETLEQYTSRAAVLARDGLSQELLKTSAVNLEQLEVVRRKFNFFSVKILSSGETLLMESTNATSEIADFKEPPARLDSVEKAKIGETVVALEEEGARQFIRTYLPLRIASKPVAIVFTTRVNPEVSAALGGVLTSYDEYKKISFYKQPLKSSYVLALALITGLILFGAIWFGFYLAREITGPVQRLAEGTQEVALGNLDLHIREGGDDEMGFLISSFNRMIRDLKGTRSQSDERQKYLEAILSNLAVGVVAVDKKFEINLANDDATRLLGLDKSAGSYGNLKQLPESAIQREIFRQIEVIESGEVAVGDVPLKIIVGGRQLEILCSAGKVGQGDGQEFGYVFIFEDVTEISIAHQMAAWREVARRIAHEIKNPLTPIKLSAQRLGRLTEGDFNKQDAFDCIQTIVENVESIKRLANEFSNFARMPTAEFTATDLNDLVSDVMMPFVEQSADVLFQVILDKNLPRVELDAEQIRRLLINVIDNAVDALTQSVQRGTKKVVVRTEFQADKGKVVLEIIDNGPGIKPQDKGRIFEPYFTTKKDGTGLGLAIVNSVVADHKGSVRVLDESPQGTKFCITLPVRQIDNRGPRVIKS